MNSTLERRRRSDSFDSPDNGGNVAALRACTRYGKRGRMDRAVTHRWVSNFAARNEILSRIERRRVFFNRAFLAPVIQSSSGHQERDARLPTPPFNILIPLSSARGLPFLQRFFQLSQRSNFRPPSMRGTIFSRGLLRRMLTVRARRVFRSDEMSDSG